ncbi:MAG: DNA-binding response regulator, partial [Bacteroidetes bacterium]
EPSVAATIRLALNALDYSVGGVAYSKKKALGFLASEKFDIALIDINLNGEFEGINIAKEINEKHHFPFVYLTAHSDRKTLEEAKQTSPAGYIIKPFTERDLLVNLEIALHNHAQKENNKYPEPQWDKMNENLIDPISKREMDVMKLIFNGYTNRQMAAELFVSANTVKTHIFRLYSKLGVSSRTEAIKEMRNLMR